MHREDETFHDLVIRFIGEGHVVVSEHSEEIEGNAAEEILQDAKQGTIYLNKHFANAAGNKDRGVSIDVFLDGKQIY